MNNKKHVSRDPASERVLMLLDKIWGGNQSKMAVDTGIAQSSLSNVRIGRTKPGRQMLEKLARHPLVNQHWLMTGEGPAIAWASSGETGSAALHVAVRPFTGLPQDNPEFLGEMREVGLRFFRKHRYWLQVSDTLRNYSTGGVKSGDWLLLDPEVDRYPNLPPQTPVLRVACNEYVLLDSEHGSLPRRATASSTEQPRRKFSFKETDGDQSSPRKSVTKDSSNKFQLVAVGVLLERYFCALLSAEV